jgi:hypothetical protein
MQRKITCFLASFTCFFHLLLAQQTTFSGHFINRDGIIELISMLNGQGNYAIEIIKEGERFEGEAKDIGGGNIEGNYLKKNKEKVAFSINYENGFYFLSSENAIIPLLLIMEEGATSTSRKVEKKNYIDHRFATGQRVFHSNGKFAFNLPDDEWSFSANDEVFDLNKESLSGWIRIFPHDLASLQEATLDENVAPFLQGGHFELISNPIFYKKLSYLRLYSGLDPQNRQVKFYIMTMVSPYGGGLHIIAGALSGKFEPAYERYMKVIADSVEFINH